MTKSQIEQLALKYRKRRFDKLNELLLEPVDAIELLTELADLGVWLTAYECWRIIDQAKEMYVEVPGGGFDVDYEFPDAELTPADKTAFVRQSIEERWRPWCELVAFYFDDLEFGELFTTGETPS